MTALTAQVSSMSAESHENILLHVSPARAASQHMTHVGHFLFAAYRTPSQTTERPTTTPRCRQAVGSKS